MPVAIQLFVVGLYLPPVIKGTLMPVYPPDDHFTAGPNRRVKGSGSRRVGRTGGCPRIRDGIVSPASVRRAAGISTQTIISQPVQIAVCSTRAEGALIVVVAVHVFVLGLYLPPVFFSFPELSTPPKRSFQCRSTLQCECFGHRARWSCSWLSKLSVLGLYFPAVFGTNIPPQTIISVPVQTAV